MDADGQKWFNMSNKGAKYLQGQLTQAHQKIATQKETIVKLNNRNTYLENRLVDFEQKSVVLAMVSLIRYRKKRI